MQFSMVKIGINVMDLERSLNFYKEAFGMTEVFRMHAKSSLNMVFSFLSDSQKKTMLNLISCAERTIPYEMGENNTHIAFASDDFMASYEKHKAMGIICIEELEKSIYYVEDPDGCQIVIIPQEYHPTYFFHGE